MQTQGITTRLDGLDPSTSSADATTGTSSMGNAARRLVLSAFVVGAAVGAWSGLALGLVAAPAAAPQADNRATRVVLDPPIQPGRRVTAASRAFVVSMPIDDAYLTSTSIPVAGKAQGRPHGPAVRSVHVELLVLGRSVKSADFDVFSGRYAGVLHVPTLGRWTEAQVRISDPLHQGDRAIVRNVTIDLP